MLFLPLGLSFHIEVHRDQPCHIAVFHILLFSLSLPFGKWLLHPLRFSTMSYFFDHPHPNYQRVASHSKIYQHIPSNVFIHFCLASILS